MTYQDIGADSEVALYHQALDDRLRVLGEDHPDTLYSRVAEGVGTYSAQIPANSRCWPDTAGRENGP